MKPFRFALLIAGLLACSSNVELSSSWGDMQTHGQRAYIRFEPNGTFKRHSFSGVTPSVDDGRYTRSGNGSGVVLLLSYNKLMPTVPGSRESGAMERRSAVDTIRVVAKNKNWLQVVGAQFGAVGHPLDMARLDQAEGARLEENFKQQLLRSIAEKVPY